MVCCSILRVSQKAWRKWNIYINFRTSISEQLPSSFENVIGLETLGLEGCSELDKLPDNIANLKSFEYICAHGSANSQLPSSAVDSSKLKDLSFVGRRGLVSLHASSLSSLSSLKKLVLGDCALTAIPPEIGYLSSLKRLWLNGNNSESLPATVTAGISRLKLLQ